MIQASISILPPTTDQWDAFGDWVNESCTPQAAVLEVGAGRGNFGYPQRIRDHVGRLAGVDPDPRIQENPFVQERYQCSLEEFAGQSASRFDCVYAFYVLEHLTDPQQFFQSCHRLLSDQGVFLAATPNSWHYFGAAAKAARRLGVEERVLQWARGAAVDTYHYPTQYRANSVRAIRRLLEAAGFREVEFTMLDNPERTECYFPRLLRVLPRAYSRLVYAFNLPTLMGTIMFRARA